MTPERWQVVKETFYSALALAPAERGAFLAEACRGNDSLRAEIESLIRSHEQTGSFIDSPAFEKALLKVDQIELNAGESVAHYEIVSHLGSGGMGEVYFARDAKLGRKVALKILPASFAAGTDRLRRFEQEARAASGLNHPNILTIYETGESDGRRYIAAELIEGETLRQRLSGRGRMAPSEVLDVAAQIASALAAAHDAGIAHRDIKPDNIMIRRDGYVKVLDFGLAKLAERQAVDSAVATRALLKTATGMIMGTTPYMSPEQARGQETDARTDIWSLGCVMQEMITGESPFAGPTAGDTIANILEHEPTPLSVRVPDAPPELQRIIKRALGKDRAERYQSAEGLLADLRKLKQELDLAARPPASGASALRGSISRRKRAALIALAASLVAFASVAGYKLFSRRDSTAAQLQHADQSVVLKTVQLTTWPGLDLYPALSPDGSAVAYTSDHNGGFEIYVKPLTPGARELQLTSDGQQNFGPAWSPDGKLIAYTSKGRGVWVVPASGGSAKQLTEFGGHPAWSPDGSLIAFQSHPGLDTAATGTGLGAGDSGNLWIVPSRGGDARPLTRAGNPVGTQGNPSWSPDGRRIVFGVSGADSHVEIWSVGSDGAGLKPLSTWSNWKYDPIYAPDGEHIYYGGVSDTGNFVLYKLRVSPAAGEAVGEPSEVFNAGLIRIKHLSISADGKKIVYTGPMMRGNLSSVSVSPVTGEATGAPVVFTQDSSYRKAMPTFSPDGRKLAFVEFRGGSFQEIWVMDADGRNPAQLTNDQGIDWSPSWFPDNDWVAYESNKQGKNALWAVSLKSGRERLLADFGQDAVGWPRVSPDGQRIAFNSGRSGRDKTWIVPVAGGEPVETAVEGNAFWSPDGKFLTFRMKSENGDQIGVMPSDSGTPTQLTFDAGNSWGYSFSPDGDKIAFAGLRDGVWNIYWVSRTTRQEKQLTHYTKRNAYVRYPAWSPDGSRIIYEYTETTSNIWLMGLK